MEKSTNRLKILALLVAFLFAALSTRLWFLQVLAADRYRDEALDNSVRIVQTDAVRGDILDARGRTLVDNRISLEVRVSQQELGENAEQILLHLSDLLQIPVKRIRERLNDPRYFDFQPIPVAVDVDDEIAFYIGEHRREFPGVQVVEASVRNYPQGGMAAHVLGWVGQISAEELDSPRFRRYGNSDLVGKAGLEQQYERFLRGRKGIEKYLVNSAGENIRQLGAEAPTAGDDLVLSLDLDIQRSAEGALIQGIERARNIFDESSGLYLRANAGAVVVLDPDDGGVRAIASWPTYDPSWFVEGLTDRQARYLFESREAPSLNRATQQIYAPGSTFKPFIALSALRNDIASLSGYYACPSQYVYPGDRSETVFHNWSGSDYGSLSVAEALKVSCDTVFYQFGADFYGRWIANPFGEGAEPLQRDLRQFGFGRYTGIDQPTEARGLIPDAGWKEEFAAENPQLFGLGEDVWLPGDDILMSIGQGYVAITPMQLAIAYAALANGGRLCRPHLVDHIERTDGRSPKRVSGRCDRRLPYQRAELSYILDALERVPQPGGTAYYSFAGFPLSEVPIAGKTGTAERPPFQDTSWFAAMVPADDPEYVIVAMVEQGGHGSTTAAPIVREIIQDLYGIEAAVPDDVGGTD
jgi:penicillin-binding protein 2